MFCRVPSLRTVLHIQKLPLSSPSRLLSLHTFTQNPKLVVSGHVQAVSLSPYNRHTYCIRFSIFSHFSTFPLVTLSIHYITSIRLQALLNSISVFFPHCPCLWSIKQTLYLKRFISLFLRSKSTYINRQD